MSAWMEVAPTLLNGSIVMQKCNVPLALVLSAFGYRAQQAAGRTSPACGVRSRVTLREPHCLWDPVSSAAKWVCCLPFKESRTVACLALAQLLPESGCHSLYSCYKAKSKEQSRAGGRRAHPNRGAGSRAFPLLQRLALPHPLSTQQDEGGPPIVSTPHLPPPGMCSVQKKPTVSPAGPLVPRVTMEGVSEMS